MKIIVTAATATVLAVGAMPALAGGMAPPVVEPAPVVVPPPVSPNGDWTGFSVGAELGYGHAIFPSNSHNGFVYGVRGAYDYDFGKFVLGVTGSFDGANIDKNNGTEKLNSIGRLGLRGGIDLGNTYLYATGGSAWLDGTSGGAKGSDNGWFAGVGAEYKLAGNWTIGGEVLTNQVHDFKNSGSDLKATTVELNMGLRF